eukprot:scaffold2861_cov107-Isochrysis_galbana.AAC.1
MRRRRGWLPTLATRGTRSPSPTGRGWAGAVRAACGATRGCRSPKWGGAGCAPCAHTAFLQALCPCRRLPVDRASESLDVASKPA